MDMARITKINADVARQVLHSLVAKSNDRFHSKGISKTTFKKEILNKAAGEHIGMLRGGVKTISRNQLKHSVKELTAFLKEHPEKYSANKHILEKIGVHAYEGSKLRENFDNPDFLKKTDKYVVGLQTEKNAANDTGPSPEEQLREKRRKAVIVNLNIRHSAEERDKLTSVIPKDVVGSANAAKAQGSVFGDTKTAGTAAGGTGKAVPGKTVSAAPRPVQLGGGMASQLGHQMQEKSTVVPVFGVTQGKAPVDAGKPATEDNLQKLVQEEAAAAKSTAKETDDLPNVDDVDTNLPLAA